MCGFFLAARPHQVRLHRLLLPLPRLTCLLLLRLLWLFLMLLRFLAKRVARCFLLFHFFPLDCQLATPPGPLSFSLSPSLPLHISYLSLLEVASRSRRPAGGLFANLVSK